MKGKVYYAIADGELQYAHSDKDVVEGYIFEKNQDNIAEAAEDCGRDIDDLTESEMAEMAFQAGFDEYVQLGEVDVPDNYDDDDEFETDEGDTFTYGELEEVYWYESPDSEAVDILVKM